VLVRSEGVVYKGRTRRFYTVINLHENGEKVDAERLR